MGELSLAKCLGLINVCNQKTVGLFLITITWNMSPRLNYAYTSMEQRVSCLQVCDALRSGIAWVIPILACLLNNGNVWHAWSHLMSIFKCKILMLLLVITCRVDCSISTFPHQPLVYRQCTSCLKGGNLLTGYIILFDHRVKGMRAIYWKPLYCSLKNFFREKNSVHPTLYEI